MRYWVWWESGGCTNQDHDTGLECFGTEEEARAFVEEEKKRDTDLSWAIIRGEVVGED